MVSPLPLLLLALTATPGAQQQQQSEEEECASSRWAALFSREIREALRGIDREVSLGAIRQAGAAEELTVLEVMIQVEDLKNATAQLLGVLNTVRSRQAASSAVQVFMALAFLAYLATIAVCYLVKRCRKHQKEVAKAEFELLETKLQASRSRRRAAAAARTNKQTPQ